MQINAFQKQKRPLDTSSGLSIEFRNLKRLAHIAELKAEQNGLSASNKEQRKSPIIYPLGSAGNSTIKFLFLSFQLKTIIALFFFSLCFCFIFLSWYYLDRQRVLFSALSFSGFVGSAWLMAAFVNPYVFGDVWLLLR